MSLKNVKEYYDKVFINYKRAVDLFNKFGEIAQERIVTPEEIEDRKKMLEPIDKDYKTISYFMFLIGKGTDHVKKYYDKLYRLNDEVQKDFIEFEEYAESTGSVDVQTILSRREHALSSQNNFEEISWLVYLLNLPNKKEKRKRYIQLNAKKFSKLGLETRYDYKLKKNEKYLEVLSKTELS